ncbi:MAG TPA: mismatch-specific DNA-glycosylase [Thermomicrobiales bacterium]|jgi:TDG/mug DNA glycosylase family protein
MTSSEAGVGRGPVDVSALRLADIIAPDLDLLFVGFNPSVYSAIHGHFYARPGNRFWLLLALAGLTPRRYAPEEDATLLDLGIGITDLCPVPTPGIADVPRALAESGRGALTAKIEHYAPRIVSFNGRATYERFFGHRMPEWGVQLDRIGTAPSLVFVTPSSSGRANGVGVAREAAYTALGELVRELRQYRIDAVPATAQDQD